jgi:leader peptidase (prepilin peptidase)/N-methyltransferase
LWQIAVVKRVPSETMIAAIVFLFGLAVGSFLNVCIVRLPRQKPEESSVVRPRSHCPACKAPIRAYDNIPLFSYVLLGGKCRACRAPISLLYPAVELLTGLLFLACYLNFGATLAAAKWAFFCALLVVLTFTDIRERILPDAVNFTGLAAGLLLSFFVAPPDGLAGWLARRWFEVLPPDAALQFADAALGAFVGAGFLWIVAEGYFRLRGREGMGLGDVKMMAMAGAFLGPQQTLLTLALGSLLGTLAGSAVIVLFRKGSDYELPFGTFLGAAGLLVVFFGSGMLHWYRSLFS